MWNPDTNPLHIQIINALMTNKNKPNVSIVTGIEIICNIGFMNIFSNVSTMTTIIEDP